MKLFLKSAVLFLTLFVLFIAAGSVILKANTFDAKNKNNFSGAQFTSSDNDDEDEEESNSSRDDDDSENTKDSSDENTDDNSVDEYNYSDDD